MLSKLGGHSALVIGICLAAAVIAVYWPVYNYDFVRFDDGEYVLQNYNLREGFNWQTIQWAFTTNRACNWHPMTWLSHTLDYQLFKNWAGGYHLANVGFHLANTILLFYVLLRMTKATWASALVAALFALHPLHVESVAWISERKDLLSTLFLLLTMLAYVRYAEKQSPERYFAVMFLFVVGLMAKPMLVTVPFALLLLDFWPLERKFNAALIVEKIPLIICSFVVSIVTFVVQKGGDSDSLFPHFDLGIRLKNVIISYVGYIWMMMYPGKLAVLYPHPGNTLGMAKVAGCALLLVVLTGLVIYFGRKHKFFVTGWFWYLGTLVPVVGFVQVGAQGMADRYTYITLIGLFVIIAWSLKEFVNEKNRKAAAITAAVVLVLFGFSAGKELRYWKTSETLFGRAIEVTNNNYMMLDNYGSILVEKGEVDGAIKCFQESVRVFPDSPSGNNNLGCALQEKGDYKSAEPYFRHAIKVNPQFIHAYLNLGRNLQRQDRIPEANEIFTKALKLDTGMPEAYWRLGLTFVELQRFELAVEAFTKVIIMDPRDVEAYGQRSMALAQIGKVDEAIADAQTVLKVRPNDVMMYRNLGLFLDRKGQTAAAIEAFKAGLQIDPNNENLRQLIEEDLKALSTSNSK
jgi:tetratricopeptide (TPR) repeat protein